MALDFTKFDRLGEQPRPAAAPAAPAPDPGKEYQENIRRAGNLRADILKGLKTGQDPLRLLLQAAECISAMTGDTVFYQQVKGDIISIYGYGLGAEATLAEELKTARERRAKLANATRYEVPEESKKRIMNAIHALDSQIARLEGILEKRSGKKNA